MNFEMLNVEDRRSIKIPKKLDLVGCWGLVKPLVASEIGGNFSTPVPYLTETSAYKIGHIFVRVKNATGCCGAFQKSYKILGPVDKFINDSSASIEWSLPRLPTVKSTKDFSNFQVRIGSSENGVIFRGYDCHQERISDQIRTVGNLQLSRNSHEDLRSADRIGLINCVWAVNKFEIRVRAEDWARIFIVGEGDHTILFGYEICDLDRSGAVVSASNGRLEKSRWLSLRPGTEDDLPLWEP